MTVRSLLARPAALALAALFSLGGCALDGPEIPATEAPEGVPAVSHDLGEHAWVVAVSHADGDEPILCTGVVVGSHTVLTRAECVPNGALATEVLFGEDARIAPRHAVHAVMVEPLEGELAVLVLRDMILAPAVELAFEPLEPGAEVQVVGYGLSGPGVSVIGLQRASTWTVARVRGRDAFLHAEDDAVCQGDVGAPVHNAAGRVLGLVDAVPVACAPGSTATARGVEAARTFLESATDMRPCGDTACAD